jgi:hypothetical protein
MQKIRLIVVAALLTATAAGCIVRTARPCRTECWWQHGHRVCAKRCY